MSKTVVYFDAVTGAVGSIKTIQANMVTANAKEGQSWKEVQENYDPAKIYVDIQADEIKDKPELPVTISSTQFSVDGQLDMTGVPAGTVFNHPDGSDVVDDGVIEWSTDEPGDYKFVLELFPYLEKEICCEVSA